MDLELAKIVYADINHLSLQWNQDIDDDSLRRSSAILRSLFIHSNLSILASQCKKELRILAPAINRIATPEELKEKLYFQAGGAKYRGTEIQFISLINGALSAEESKKIYEKEKLLIGKSYPVKINEFLKQPSFAIEGTLINREEVIKYVANKLGGAHYDNTRKRTELKKNTLDDKYALLDKVRHGTTIADKNAIYYELLSIGQRLINSKDIQLFMKYLKKLLDTQ